MSTQAQPRIRVKVETFGGIAFLASPDGRHEHAPARPGSVHGYRDTNSDFQDDAWARRSRLETIVYKSTAPTAAMGSARNCRDQVPVANGAASANRPTMMSAAPITLWASLPA